MEKPKESWLAEEGFSAEGHLWSVGMEKKEFLPARLQDKAVNVIEKAPVLLALKQSKNAILSVIHTVDPRSPAGKELKLALEMIREIVP